MNAGTKLAKVGVGDSLSRIEIRLPAGEADKALIEGVSASIVEVREIEEEQ